MAEPGTAGKRPGQGKAAKDLNEQIRYTMWSVYRAVPGAPTPRGTLADVVARAAEQDVVLRGAYDVGGLRADADVMVWWHGPSADALQEAYRGVRRRRSGPRLAPVWSQMALHRPAEFNKATSRPSWPTSTRATTCASTRSCAPTSGTCSRSPSGAPCWPSTARWRRDYPDVRANTVASFALGDYEWMLAFEADELHRIVDLMRHLRGSERPPPRPRGGARSTPGSAYRSIG